MLNNITGKKKKVNVKKEKIQKDKNNAQDEYIIVHDLKITIKRKSRQKHIYIKTLPPDGRVLITCSKSVTQKYLKRLVLSKYENIQLNIKKVIEKNMKSKMYQETGYEKGDKYYIFGEEYTLAKTTTSKELDNMYRKILKKEILEIGEKYAEKMGVYVLSWNIRKMKTRWGTCNISKKRIWINLELVKREKCCLEYVIVHELAHLIEKNHNKRFYQIVKKYYDNYLEVEDILKKG